MSNFSSDLSETTRRLHTFSQLPSVSVAYTGMRSQIPECAQTPGSICNVNVRTLQTDTIQYKHNLTISIFLKTRMFDNH